MAAVSTTDVCVFGSVCVCVSAVFQFHCCVQTLILISLSSVIHWDSSCRWVSPFDLGILWPYCPSHPMRSFSSPNKSSDLNYNQLTQALLHLISCSWDSPSCDLSCWSVFSDLLQSVSIRIQFLQSSASYQDKTATLLRHAWWIILPDEEISRRWRLNLISFTLAHTRKRKCEGKWTRHDILPIMECNDNQCQGSYFQSVDLQTTSYSWFKITFEVCNFLRVKIMANAICAIGL